MYKGFELILILQDQTNHQNEKTLNEISRNLQLNQTFDDSSDVNSEFAEEASENQIVNNWQDKLIGTNMIEFKMRITNLSNYLDSMNFGTYEDWKS